MIILIGAIILGIAFLVWLWKVPIKKMVEAMKASGSTAVEAYIVVFLLFAGIAGTIYMIMRVT
jgi:hypothetical protein